MAPTTKRAGREARDLADPTLYVNRELSWLEFNAHVLALAADPDTPLLERCKFLAIFSSNLDEFFMVRVAGQQDALEAARPPSTPDQLPREEVLERVAARSGQLVAEQSRIWAAEVRPALAAAGLPVLSPGDLSGKSARTLVTRFERELYPILTPLAVGPGQPFPYISGLSLNLGVTVHDPVGEETRFARVKLYPGLPRFTRVDDGFVPTEEVVEAHLDRIFPGMEIMDVGLFRVTRDADFSI